MQGQILTFSFKKAAADCLSVGCATTDSSNKFPTVYCCRIFEMASEDGDKATEFGDDRVFNDLRYTINSDKLHALGWTEVQQ